MPEQTVHDLHRQQNVNQVTIQRELGSMHESLLYLREGNDRLEQLAKDNKMILRAALDAHAIEDTRRFDELRAELSAVKVKLAYYVGGLAVIISIFQYILKS